MTFLPVTPALVSKFMTARADIYRHPAVTSGSHRELPTLYSENVFVTPLYSADLRDRERAGLSTHQTLYALFAKKGSGIQRNDILHVESRQYPVRYVAPWPEPSSDFVQVLVDEVLD